MGEFLKTLPRTIWIVLGFFLLFVIITSYSQGKISGIEKCKTV